MRAARVTSLDGPQSLELAEVDEPSADGGIVVDVHAAGVAFPDALLTRGLYQYRPELPFTLGAELAGVVRSAPDLVFTSIAGAASDAQQRWNRRALPRRS